MDCIEQLTDSGRGSWGYHPVVYSSSTITETWHARTGGTSRSIETYRLTFSLDGSAPSFRSFPTVSARDAFMHASTRDRAPLTGVGEAPLVGCTPWITPGVVGDELSAITFVADYFQLRLLKTHADFYVWPIIRTPAGDFRFGESGYRDALCSFIGEPVTEADVFLDDGIVLVFPNGELHVTPEQIRLYEFPEVIEGDINVSAGEPPFDQSTP